VAASPFQGGRGDVVRQFVDAAREGNLRVAFALSPLDRHDPSYGTPAYLSVFECQLTELLTNYGAVDEIWLWQAPGRPEFDWAAIRDLVRQLQPQALLELANLAPMAANDLRSIGLSSPPGASPVPSDQSSVQSPGGAAAYIPAEHLGVSGVLATVTAGGYLGWRNPELLSALTRFRGKGVWSVLLLLFNGLVFILIGLQLASIRALSTGVPWLSLIGYAAAVSGVDRINSSAPLRRSSTKRRHAASASQTLMMLCRQKVARK